MNDPSRLPPMTCAETQEAVEAFVGGSLDASEESRLARHLTRCPACAASAAVAERVAVELATLPAFDAPPELIDRIKATARAGEPRVVAFEPRRRRRWARRLAAAAALVAALALGWSQLDREPRPSAAEIAAAEREARYALALVARLGRRAGEEVRDEVLVERVAVPVIRTMKRRFGADEKETPGGQKS